MPRDHGAIRHRIWSDPEFLRLPADSQRVYMMLVSQPSLNLAGVLDLTLGRWARYAPDTGPGDIRDALRDLDAARFLVVDGDTEEVLIRTLIRGDEMWRQVRTLRAAVRACLAVQSPTIRATLADELDRLPAVPVPVASPARATEALEVQAEVADAIVLLRGASPVQATLASTVAPRVDATPSPTLAPTVGATVAARVGPTVGATPSPTPSPRVLRARASGSGSVKQLPEASELRVEVRSGTEADARDADRSETSTPSLDDGTATPADDGLVAAEPPSSWTPPMDLVPMIEAVRADVAAMAAVAYPDAAAARAEFETTPVAEPDPCEAFWEHPDGRTRTCTRGAGHEAPNRGGREHHRDPSGELWTDAEVDAAMAAEDVPVADPVPPRPDEPEDDPDITERWIGSGEPAVEAPVIRDPERVMPSPRCPQHRELAKAPPCGRCKEAAARSEAWKADRDAVMVRARAEAQAEIAAEVAADRAAIGRCRDCDDRGVTSSGVRCTHDGPGAGGRRLPGREAFKIEKAKLDAKIAAKRTTPDEARSVVPAEPAATADQLTAIATALGARGIASRDVRLAAIADVVGHPVGSSKDLTRAEASTVIDALSDVPPPPDPGPVSGHLPPVPDQDHDARDDRDGGDPAAPVVDDPPVADGPPDDDGDPFRRDLPGWRDYGPPDDDDDRAPAYAMSGGPDDEPAY